VGIAGLTSQTDRSTQAAAYRAAIASLFARTGGSWSFGLDRMRALLKELGSPDRRFPSIHVAGTNGKGSVVATMEALAEGGSGVIARYTSPHLVDYRERMLVRGRALPAETVTEWVERWTPAVERLGATFFEATTAMAFDLFAREAVDLALIEAGLGGRLDATNVIMPEAAVVTSVGIDHVEYLGTTRESIAREKAGIFKRGVPAVIGEQDPAIAQLLADHAWRAGATPIILAQEELAPRDVHVAPEGTWVTLRLGASDVRVRSPLVGRHQAQNLATALAALRILGRCPDPVEVQARLERVWLPGRFQQVGPFVFDVAHNPDGAEVLARTIADAGVQPPITVLLTVLADKDWRGIMRALAPIATGFVLTRSPSAPASRAWDPHEGHAFAVGEGWQAALVPDFDQAIVNARAAGGTVLVTGSFHTVGDAMTRLQVDPLAG
jgi:dihydrofolate synthase / folylpolyglutamate synthase